MASSIIHMCVAKEINKSLKIKDENMLLLGSIAPDISKHIGEDKTRSHFLDDEGEVNIEKFLSKYQGTLKDPFMMGYYIHLYTDLLWYRYFMDGIVLTNSIKLLDGTTVPNNDKEYVKYIYNDYTNLNTLLIDKYDIDLSLFYDKCKVPDVKMDEIPIDKLQLLIDYSKVILENSKQKKAYTFTLENVDTFINTCTHLLILAIKEIEND